MRAYIISPENGVVIIDDTLYQPGKGKCYYVGKTIAGNPGDFPFVEVPDSSMESAALALKRFIEMSQKS